MFINHKSKGRVFYFHMKSDFVTSNERWMFNKMRELYKMGLEDGERSAKHHDEY